jgi:hypothetical protein
MNDTNRRVPGERTDYHLYRRWRIRAEFLLRSHSPFTRDPLYRIRSCRRSDRASSDDNSGVRHEFRKSNRSWIFILPRYAFNVEPAVTSNTHNDDLLYRSQVAAKLMCNAVLAMRVIRISRIDARLARVETDLFNIRISQSTFR